MDKTVKTVNLQNAYMTTSTDAKKNTVDIHCLSIASSNTISIDDAPYMVLAQDTNGDIIGHHIGYGGSYKITAQNGGAGEVQCMMTEYSDSPTLNFMTGGEFFLIGTLFFYFLFFALGLRLSFFR